MLKCLVCGMIINEKNYNINSYAFSHKNESENIVYCPFCGVGKVYLKDNGQVYKIESKNLDIKTLKILDNAMKLETFNGDFYMEISKLAKDEKLKNMFVDLSKIEYMHARVHKNLGGFKDSPKLNKLDYDKYDNDVALLEAAQRREEHAVAFYKKFYNDICNEKIKSVFDGLIKVEKEHIDLTSIK